MVCVLTTFSVNCILIPWQMATIDRRFWPTATVMLLEVTLPPCGDGVVTLVVLRSCLPATSHFTSAGGLLLSVVHVNATLSPALASVAPDIVTCAGATEHTHNYKTKPNQNQPF